MVSLPRALALLPPSPLAHSPASAAGDGWQFSLEGLDVRRRLKFFSRRAVLCVCFWGIAFFLKIYFVNGIFAVHGWKTVTNIWSHVWEMPTTWQALCNAECVVVTCSCRLQGCSYYMYLCNKITGGLIVVTSFSYMLHDVWLWVRTCTADYRMFNYGMHSYLQGCRYDMHLHL